MDGTAAPILILAGPTAVGKTALSLLLAHHLGAEIISADSRQVYRRLDIGTAKPSPAEQRSVPHHFIDEFDLGTPFSAGRFAESACQRIGQIYARGKVPLVVGGSTLYLSALQNGIAPIPAIDPGVRAGLMQRLADEGAAALYRQLGDVDPASAARMDATKTERIVRALEVYTATGKPISFFQQQQTPPPYRFLTVVLNREREDLYNRINRRVDAMLDDGLLGEVAHLIESASEAAMGILRRTIGYQEPIAHLMGEIDDAEMVRLIKRNTRRYAKRQITWFRRIPGAHWLDATRSPPTVVSQIISILQ